jgi:hypothetical protein
MKIERHSTMTWERAEASKIDLMLDAEEQYGDL